MAWRKKQKDTNIRSPRDQSKRSAPVFSYYSSRSANQDTSAARSINRAKPAIPNVRLSTTVWWIRYMPSLLSLGIVVLAIMYTTTLSTSPRLNVRSSNPDATTTLQESGLYQSAARELFEESIFNRSKLTFDSDKMAANLENRFPELDEVVVAIPLFGRKPTIEVQPAIPALLLSAKNGVYVIDQSGTAVLRAADLASSARDKLPVVSDDTDAEINLGNQVLPIDTVKFITELGNQFQFKNIRTGTFNLPTIANEIHVKPAGRPFYVKFNTEYDVRLQAGTLFALLDRLEGEGKTPAEYIDVRVEERVFYK